MKLNKSILKDIAIEAMWQIMFFKFPKFTLLIQCIVTIIKIIANHSILKDELLCRPAH